MPYAFLSAHLRHFDDLVYNPHLRYVHDLLRPSVLCARYVADMLSHFGFRDRDYSLNISDLGHLDDFLHDLHLGRSAHPVLNLSDLNLGHVHKLLHYWHWLWHLHYLIHILDHWLLDLSHPLLILDVGNLLDKLLVPHLRNLNSLVHPTDVGHIDILLGDLGLNLGHMLDYFGDVHVALLYVFRNCSDLRHLDHLGDDLNLWNLHSM
mmetsp:Transcript_1450/g.3305  ORF Transcript_1450/g.3305 Transcript_1450/m.3305 type:complete len:207 (-) Transcript_1450:1645-2265(-)